MVLHRIVGAFSSMPRGGIYSGLEKFVGGKSDTFGEDITWPSFVSQLQRCKLIFLGEVHSVPAITEFQFHVIKALTPKQDDDDPSTSKDSTTCRRKLHVVMEHFSFDMQELLDNFTDGRLTFADLTNKYREIGSEGHNLEPYQPILEHAQLHKDRVRLHSGFISKKYARQLMKEGEEAALSAAKDWLPVNLTRLEGSAFHYTYFESLLTGRNLHLTSSSSSSSTPSNRFRRIFKAQLLKDVAMAHRVDTLLQEVPEDDQVVVITGNGHVEYYQGVPERVLATHPDLIDKTCLITCHSVGSETLLQEKTVSALMELLNLGLPGANPADFVFLYRDDYAEERSPPPRSSTSNMSPKEETRSAYDQVGATAHLKGNQARAEAIMTYLGYTQEEINIAGMDAYNFQGVGNPHIHANVKPGETVLDIGSGLGIDSFIAAHKTGPRGRVIGIDIAPNEVTHAQHRADERGLDIRFATADMERLPLPDNSFDVVISNGAFCLAPNKEAAFAEIFRVLKPGGRMAVCTSTIQQERLDQAVEWPICMRMFIEKKLIKPMCERIGFADVKVDDRDSKMVFELSLPKEAAASLNPQRYRVHGDSPEFAHLERFDMDKLCARVCVVARKPAAGNDGAVPQ